MNCQNRLRSAPCAWIEGESTVKNLLTDLSYEIVNAYIPNPDGGGEYSRWEILYKEREHDFVTYELDSVRVTGKYIHEDGNESTVYKIPNEPKNYKASDGYFYEAKQDTPFGEYTDTHPEHRTGKRISFAPFTHNGEVVEIENALVTLVDMHPDTPVRMFPNRWEKYQAYVVKHTRIDYLGNDVEDENWNYYKLVAPLPDDWTYFLYNGTSLRVGRYQYTQDGSIYTAIQSVTIRSSYSVDHYTFTPKYYAVTEKLVLECNTNNGYKYTIYFEKPLDSSNYVMVQYGVEIKYQRNLRGDPEESYRLACDLDTLIVGRTPKIIDEHEAYRAFERQLNNYYEPGDLVLGGVRSPISYWFFSENSTKRWLIPNMRGKDSVVKYWISFNNDRAIILLEGDPNFEFESFYRSFAYFGKFIPLNPDDVETNFAVTVGMGALDKNKSGFVLKDIDKESNPDYAKYGAFTSNGMDTVSVYRGISRLPYQEYLPAFLVQLPNYPSVGTLPKGVGRLVLADYLFQPSQWTDHVHSSPIYLVNGYEGYRGYLDGIVAIYDQYLRNGDELDWDVGDYVETYKFFNINVPISFLDKSPAPGGVMSVAILKEIKRR